MLQPLINIPQMPPRLPLKPLKIMSRSLKIGLRDPIGFSCLLGGQHGFVGDVECTDSGYEVTESGVIRHEREV
jgi:hypothetical protein